MNIAVISTVHDIRDPRVSLKISGSLARLGCHVDLIGGVSSPEDPEVALEFLAHLPEGVTPRLLQSGQGFTGRIQRIKEAVALNGKLKPDLLYIHDPELIPPAEVIRFRYNIPYIFDLHEDVFDRIGLRLEILQRLVRYAFRSADGVVTAFALQHRPYHPIPGVPHQEILNYFPEITFPLPPHTDIPPKKARYRFCYTGTIAPDRNITGLIRFVDQSISAGLDIELIIAGKVFMSGYLKNLRSTLQQCRHRDRIHLIGGDRYTDWFTLQRIHQSSDAGTLFFHPNALNWNYPTKLYEYFGCGLPVICTDMPRIRGLIEKLNAGFFIPHDDFNLAFETLRDNLSRLDQINSEKLRSWVVQHANWHHQELSLAKLIDQVSGIKNGSITNFGE